MAETLFLGRNMMTKETVRTYSLITLSTLIISVGIYFFKFPNDFTFGGVSGLSVVLGKITPLSPATSNFILNILLVAVGFLFLGKSFGLKTVYSSLLLSGTVSALGWFFPMKQPLTDQPMLELIFAVALPAFGSALLFYLGASSGGTDIIAMILKKHTSADIGRALFYSDLLITLSAFFIFSIKTALFSFLGLLMKSLVIDGVIESINLSKYFNVICSKPDVICDYIVDVLHRSATVCDATGAFSHNHKYIIFTVMKRSQAAQLRKYIKKVEPDAFLLISNTSEIIGKGFHSE